MNRPIGKLPGLVLLLALLTGSAVLRAEVNATVDRQQLALGDTLRLVISATEDDEDINGVDLSHLELDFELLQRSTRSNTSIVNGKRSHNRELIVEMTPRRAGTLTVPAFRVGSGLTRPLKVIVGDAPQVDPGSETVLFDAELDRDQAYVQGQLILTLRLQQAINLDRRSISELELDNAFVVPLEQQSFQRTINGRPWLVHEVRYAIFPEQSGTLEIPAQSFSARESRPRRSLFDSVGAGKLIRRSTPALQVTVLPRPADYPANATWLPAQSVTVNESWSADPATLRAGESVTRTIEIRGTGLQGAQLPPVSPGVTEGLKFFPDQPSIADSETSDGILGSRRDSVAIVPTRGGQVTLPEIRIPWWDTEAGELRIATLPARTLDVAAAVQTELDTVQAAPSSADTAALAPAPQGQGSSILWQLIAAGCALGWAVTLVLLWYSRRPGESGDRREKDDRPARLAYKQLLAACASDQARQARAALVNWGAAVADDKTLGTLAAVSGLFGDEALDREIELLERSLYAESASQWTGASLATAVQQLQQQLRDRQRGQEEQLTLYPAS